MIAQNRAESTRDIYNYRQYMNKIPPNTIKAIRLYERIQKKICRQKMSIMFNEIYIYIYIYNVSHLVILSVYSMLVYRGYTYTTNTIIDP